MQTASALSGFYLLTADGELAFHDEHGRRVIDVPLTHTFRRHNEQFLRTYLNDAEAEGEASRLRVGVVCRSQAKTKWSSDTLILETAALRNLYWKQDLKQDAELTEFQKRSREQSIYRGMELLLEFRKEGLPGLPVYCPVLFDRGTFLGEYASAPEWGGTRDGFRVRVLEVLNLIATVPAMHRTSPAIFQLLRSIHARVIRKDVRRPASFAVTGEFDARLHGATDWLYPRFDANAVSIPTLTDAAEPEGAAPPPIGAARVDRTARRARSAARSGVQKIARRVEPAVLRAFARLADLAREDLALIASETRLYTALAGTELLKQGAIDNGAFYLLDGKVRLEAPDGRTQRIASGTDAAQRPVAHLKPRKYTVIAETPVTFLWIPDKLLKAVLDRYPMPGEIRVDLGFGRFPMLLVI